MITIISQADKKIMILKLITQKPEKNTHNGEKEVRKGVR